MGVFTSCNGISDNDLSLNLMIQAIRYKLIHSTKFTEYIVYNLNGAIGGEFELVKKCHLYRNCGIGIAARTSLFGNSLQQAPRVIHCSLVHNVVRKSNPKECMKNFLTVFVILVLNLPLLS